MSEIAELKPRLVEVFANRYGVDADKVLGALKSTAFRQSGNAQISNDQMMALMIVANQYELNPFTKEIYAYPDKGGIVPVVSVDGWSRIINSNPAMDGIEFEYSEERVEHKGKSCHVWIDCLIYRKDRSRPIKIREFFNEVVRSSSYTSPWDTHPNRMHRHKAEIQCARVAFGFAGIYDQDEAERVLEASTRIEPANPEIKSHTDKEKEYFDNLIASDDARGLYVYSATVGQGLFSSLYNSFERGDKVKFKALVDKLVAAGESQLRDYQAIFDEGDDSAIKEVLEELTPEEIEIILKWCTGEVERFVRGLM